MAPGLLLTVRLGFLIAILAASASAGPNRVSPPASSCYSGVAELRVKIKDHACIKGNARLRPLTAPMDFSTDLPWDCLENLLVSVEGCKVSIISLVNSSSMLPGFACNWLEYQGAVETAGTARVALWVRPITAAKWVLYNTNLTTWRARGTATLTFDDLEQALIKIYRRDPTLPLNLLMRQREIIQLKRDSLHFQQQLQQEDDPQVQAAAAAAIAAGIARQQTSAAGPVGGGRKLRQLRQLQQQQLAAEQPAGDQAAAGQPAAAGGEPVIEDPPLPPAVLPEPTGAPAGTAAGDAAAADKATVAAVAAALPPVGSMPKPPLPPGVEADIGNGLVSEPIDWQKFLADIYSSNGSPVIAIPENNTINLYNNGRCNITYEIVSGGLLGVGTVDKSTVGMFALSAIEPFELPYMFEIDKSLMAAEAAGAPQQAGSSSGISSRGSTSIALITILSVLGAALIGSLAYLGVKLYKAPKGSAAAAAAFGNGVGRVDGMSPLEQSARAHGPQGGI